MDLGLTNHVAVVTGGASGIGRAAAANFLREGARIALWDASAKVVEAAIQLSQQYGGEAVGLCVDVTDLNAVNRALEQTVKQWASIEHLVHAAAIGSGKFGFPFTNLSPADWP